MGPVKVEPQEGVLVQEETVTLRDTEGEQTTIQTTTVTHVEPIGSGGAKPNVPF